MVKFYVGVVILQLAYGLENVVCFWFYSIVPVEGSIVEVNLPS